MLVEVVAVFRCPRDAHDAFRAVKEVGISPDLIHLLESEAPMVCQDEVDWSCADDHRLDQAEYAAHAEHLGSLCADASVGGRPLAPVPPMTGNRLMVVVRDCKCALAAAKLLETLFANGAIAARNNNGPWRRSPYRRTAQPT